MDINELQAILKAQYPTMDAILIHREDLVFEERVKLKCYQCRNYNTKWSCPGKLPQIDFRKVISEYTNMAVIIYKKSAVRNQKSEVRDQKSEDDYRAASNELHRAMLYLEAEMMKRNNPLAQSFIGGYCALCKDACPPDKCATPSKPASVGTPPAAT